MDIRKALIVVQYKNTKAHIECKRVLAENGIRVKTILRTNMKFGKQKDFDIVITIGGDGTLIRTSHFILDDTPILGVNADPLEKVGFFLRSDEKDFELKFSQLLNGKNKMLKLSRLECIKNGKKLPFLALNEFFVGHAIPYKMARYWLNGEYQRGSGVIIGTASGSYAWLKSAGGKTLPLESEKFQFISREVYESFKRKPKKTSGILEKNTKIEIESEMKNGIIVVDCLSDPYHLKKGEKVVFCQSNNKLNLISF